MSGRDRAAGDPRRGSRGARPSDEARARGRATGLEARVDPVTRLRNMCLALPEAEERETFGGPTFRVRDKIFVLQTARDGDLSFWCKAPPGSQAILVGADPARFFAPPYLGPKGWIGVRLVPAPDWDEVAALVGRSYRLVAPRKLAGKVESLDLQPPE